MRLLDCRSFPRAVVGGQHRKVPAPASRLPHGAGGRESSRAFPCPHADKDGEGQPLEGRHGHGELVARGKERDAPRQRQEIERTPSGNVLAESLIGLVARGRCVASAVCAPRKEYQRAAQPEGVELCSKLCRCRLSSIVACSAAAVVDSDINSHSGRLAQAVSAKKCIQGVKLQVGCRVTTATAALEATIATEGTNHQSTAPERGIDWLATWHARPYIATRS